MKKRSTLFAVLASLILAVTMMPGPAFAADDAVPYETHSIAVASDLDSDLNGDTTITDAMKGMPASVEYVSILGNLVDSKAPAYDSSVFFDQIMALGFEGVRSKEDMSLLWAETDVNVNDNAEIVFASGGNGSGLMRTGLNGDGSVAYYIYGVAYNELADPDAAQAAAQDFMTWIDTVEDTNIPVFVFSNFPLHFAKGDNAGAMAWCRALNYAASGKTDPTLNDYAARDVVFFYGHNWKTEAKNDMTGEFYVPAGKPDEGTFMEIGPNEGSYAPIYYTYVTAGYLGCNSSASLITIDRDFIYIDKYQLGKPAGDGFYDLDSHKSGSFSSAFSGASANKITRVGARYENPMKVKVTPKTLKAKDLKKKKAVVQPIKVTGQEGKLSFMKLSGPKKCSVNAKTGTITVMKGAGKGTYKVKVKVTAAGNSSYQPKEVTVTAVIKVK